MLAVACLALGVGTSAAMLGLLDSMLFRPPAHVAEPESIRRVYIADSFPGIGTLSSTTSYPILRDLETVRSFAAAGAFFTSESTLGRGAEARKVRSVLVTPSFLRLLGVQPVQAACSQTQRASPASQGSSRC